MTVQAIILSLLVSLAWCALPPPSSIKYGAGSSAFQIEGAWSADGKSCSVLDVVYQSPDNGNASTACNSYYFWKKDVQIAKEMGLNYYRFSISWSRLLPSGKPDYINMHAVVYYDNLINALLENNIEPVITLYHFDLPQALQDEGSLMNPAVADWLADYARVVFDLYGDRVKTFLTINEPIVLIYSHNSKICQDCNTYEITKNILIAHAKVWRLYDEEYKPRFHGQLSIVNYISWFEGETTEDEELAEQARQLCAGIFSHAIYGKEGGWPSVVERIVADYSARQGLNTTILPAFTQAEIELVKGTYDFYAFNYYLSSTIREAKPGEEVGSWPFEGSPELNAVLSTRPEWPTTECASFTIYPVGLRYNLRWLRQQYGDMPFMIAENGYCSESIDLDDDDRIQFIEDHIDQVTLAIDEGINVTAYTVWSIMDDFEFDEGYTIQFGLYYVNMSDPERPRIPRKSAMYYRDVIRAAEKQLYMENAAPTD